MKKKNKFIIILILSFTVLGLTFGIFVSQTNIEQNKAKKSYKKGFKLYNDYKFEAAQDYFLESLSYNPNFNLSRRMLGQALYFSGDIDEAINEWKLVFNNNTHDPSLKLHIQNIKSFQLKQDLDLQFKKIFKNKFGYRYKYPTFVHFLPSHQMFFLALGLSNKGAMITISAQGQLSYNRRHISEEIGLPIGAAIGKKEIWITDYKKDGIHRINKNDLTSINIFNKIPLLGKQGSNPLEFRGPAGICYNKQGFYIVDSENNRIQNISESGQFILSINSIQNKIPLRKPFGVACSKNGNIYVSLPYESKIVLFDSYGNFIKNIGRNFLKKPRHIQIDSKNKYLIIADEEAGVFIIDLVKNKRYHINGYYDLKNNFIKFRRVYSAQFDFFGNLYIADYASHQIMQFIPKNFLYNDLDLWIERIDVKKFPDIGVWVSIKNQSGNYISDLQSSNFSLFENDAEIDGIGTSYLKQFKKQINVIIVLSRAKRMKNYLDNLIRITEPLINNLYENDQFQVVSYNETFRENSPWTNSTLRIKKALLNYNEKDYKNNNNQATGKILYQSISKLLSKRGKKAIVWIFDGTITNESFKDFSLSKISSYARNNHIPIYILNYEHPDNLHKNKDKQNLINLTKSTLGRYYRSFSPKIKNLKKLIKAQLSEKYVLNYESNGNKDWKGQYMEIKIKVNFQDRLGIENLGFFIP